MTRVELTRRIAVPAASAYALAVDFESFRALMPNVVGLTVHPNGPDAQESEWEAVHYGQVIRWREEDTFDRDALEIRSRLVDSGFFRSFVVECRFVPDGDGAVVKARIEVDPIRYVQVAEPIVRALIRTNFKSLLDRVEAVAAAGAGEAGARGR